jgi:hypothetical protein
VLTAVFAFVGVLAGNLVNRRGARELDVWRKREETMKLLRWAVELYVKDNSAMGIVVLNDLISSELVQDIDRPFMAAIAKDAQEIATANMMAQAQPFLDSASVASSGERDEVARQMDSANFVRIEQ